MTLDGKNTSILIFTNLSLKIQFSFSDKCGPQTMVVLGVPVTLSPIEMKDTFLSHYSYRYFGNIFLIILQTQGSYLTQLFNGFLKKHMLLCTHVNIRCQSISMHLILCISKHSSEGRFQRAQRVHGRKRLRTPVYIIPCNYKHWSSQHLSSQYVGKEPKESSRAQVQ